jgi:mannose-6-phosphate isomerase-like protein (cupin superfamily)
MLPGGIGISRLCVYDTLAPDGRPGGSPHVHLACTEAYVVTGGAGAVQTLSGKGFAENELRPGTLLWLTPGTVHRLVNHGGLEIVVAMANSGLPEAGDAVFTFPPDVLADPAAYERAAAVPDVEAAYRRRDLALAGFQDLRDGGEAGLAEFYRAAVKLKQPQLDAWRTRWHDGARRAAELTGEHLDALGRGDIAHLTAAAVHAIPEPSERGRLGMCGRLDTYRV